MPGSNYTAEKIQSMFGNSEIDLRFTNPIPVHITYQTAFVDESGQLQIREDLYGRDARLLTALKEDRRQAEIPIARVQTNQGRPPVRLPPGYGNDSWSNGPSFFDRLFGNPIQPIQPQKQRRASRTTTR